MKKILLALVGVFMAFSVSALDVEEGKQYTALSRLETAQPQVIEFFSFYCPACFKFDQQFKVSQQIKASLPENVEYHKYHVSFMGGNMGMMLTQAWSVAIVLNVEEKVKPLLFEAVQVKRNLKDLKDIREIFIQAGVTGEQFDEMWDSFVIKSLLSKQLQEAENMELSAVPAVYVNGKYLIKNEGMNSIEEFVSVANYLALKK